MSIYCGTAKVNITPPKELLPRLYGLMHSRFGGVIDEISVRMMILSNGQEKALFVSWDLDKAPVPEVIVPELSKASGIPEDNILYFVVHTHTAPMHSARPGDGPNAKALQDEDTIKATDEYEELLRQAAGRALEQALGSMQSARLGWSLGESWVGENRLQDYFVENADGSIEKICAIGSNPKKAVDRTLFLLKVQASDGKPIAFFINHAVHNTVMILNKFTPDGKVGISADMGGNVSRLLEERYPGSVALWSSGAAGDINPVMMNQYNIADPLTGEPVEFKDYTSVEPAKLMLLMLSSRQFADVLSAERKIVCETDSAKIQGGKTLVEQDFGDPEAPYRLRLSAVRIGELIFCGASGELFGSLGAAIQSVSPAAKTVVINHECSLLVDGGYVFDDDALERCRRKDGTRDGIPGIRHTKMQPGYIETALKKGAGGLFERIYGGAE